MIWIVLVAVGLVVLTGATLHGTLSSRRDRCRQVWSELRARLDRRADLVDTLGEVVGGAVTGQDNLLERLRAARDEATQATEVPDRARAERAFVEALDTVFALARSYPHLQANQDFARLRDERTSHDNRIAAAADAYNDAVAAYNQAVATLPTRVVARLFHFEPRPRFEPGSASAEPA